MGTQKAREEGIDLILAVGGGSVIDAAKAISYALCYEGDVWDFYAGKAQAQKALPVGVVLTLAASGSELSNSSVITNDRTHEKGAITAIWPARFCCHEPGTYHDPAGLPDGLRLL